MNKDLLFQLYEIHSPSGGEKKMRAFIKRYVADNCKGCRVDTDVHGNLFITKGKSKTYPCLAAHMDQVQDAHSKDFAVVEIGGDVIGWSVKDHEQQGLGADDKNGIFICLEILCVADVLKVAFFVGEEIGCRGSGACDLKFFKDCRFIIEPDRKGFNDLITSMFCGAVCSDDFVDAIEPFNPGYEEARGSVTDVGELVERGVGISCINISCGYYEAHTDHEYTVLGELELTLEFVKTLVENLTDVYPYKYKGYSYGGKDYDWNGYGYGYNYGYKYGGGVKKYEPVKTLSQQKEDEWESDPMRTYWEHYDDDFDEMYNILCGQPYLTFDELAADWGCNFYTKDIDLLRDIYDDAITALGIEEEDEAYWNGEHEDEEEGDIVLELEEPEDEEHEDEEEEVKDDKTGLQVVLDSIGSFFKKVS